MAQDALHLLPPDGSAVSRYTACPEEVVSTELYPGSLDTVTVADAGAEADAAPPCFELPPPPPPHAARHRATPSPR